MYGLAVLCQKKAWDCFTAASALHENKRASISAPAKDRARTFHSHFQSLSTMAYKLPTTQSVCEYFYSNTTHIALFMQGGVKLEKRIEEKSMYIF